MIDIILPGEIDVALLIFDQSEKVIFNAFRINHNYKETKLKIMWNAYTNICWGAGGGGGGGAIW